MKRHVETYGVITRLFSLGDKQQKEKNIPDNVWNVITRNHSEINEMLEKAKSVIDHLMRATWWGL